MVHVPVLRSDMPYDLIEEVECIILNLAYYERFVDLASENQRDQLRILPSIVAMENCCRCLRKKVVCSKQCFGKQNEESVLKNKALEEVDERKSLHY